MTDSGVTRKYKVLTHLKEKADKLIQKYYLHVLDIESVVKDNYSGLTDKNKEDIIKSIQDQMKQCKIELEQLEQLSIGDVKEGDKPVMH